MGKSTNIHYKWPFSIAMLVHQRVFCSKTGSYNPPWGEAPSRSPQGSKAKGSKMAPICSAPVAPTEHVAAPDVHVDSAPGLNSGSWMGCPFIPLFWGEDPAKKIKKCGKWMKMVGDIILKNMLLIFVEGYPRLPVMPRNVLRQPQAAVSQYGVDLQQMAMDERCVSIRPAKPEWLVGSKPSHSYNFTFD